MSIQKRSGRCEKHLSRSQPTVMSSLKSWNLVMRHDQVEIEEHLPPGFLASSQTSEQIQMLFFTVTQSKVWRCLPRSCYDVKLEKATS